MPLLAGKKNIGRNIKDMENADHPRAQAIAASLRKAGVNRKDSHMAKHEHGMAGEMGMSPRKAMASGKMGGGNFGVKSYDAMNDGTGAHPDHVAHTGMKGHMADHERAAGPGIMHTPHHHPAQAAPTHGHTHPGRHGHHHSYETKA